MIYAAGHSHGEGLWEDYLSILTDPAHFLAELTFTLFDIIILSPIIFFAWKGVKAWTLKHIAHEHSILDAEHGIEHRVSSCPNCDTETRTKDCF